MTSKADLITSQIALYKNRSRIVEARIDEKMEEHQKMLDQVHYSKEYESIFDEQLQRTLHPMWNELVALAEKVEGLEKELEALKALEAQEAQKGEEGEGEEGEDEDGEGEEGEGEE